MKTIVVASLGVLCGTVGYLLCLITSMADSDMKYTEFELISCKSLAVVDSDGIPKISLTVDDDGMGQILMSDNEQDLWFGVNSQAGQGQIFLCDNHGNTKLLLKIDQNSMGQMSLIDKEVNLLLGAGVHDGKGKLILGDNKGQLLESLP